MTHEQSRQLQNSIADMLATVPQEDRAEQLNVMLCAHPNLLRNLDYGGSASEFGAHLVMMVQNFGGEELLFEFVRCLADERTTGQKRIGIIRLLDSIQGVTTPLPIMPTTQPPRTTVYDPPAEPPTPPARQSAPAREPDVPAFVPTGERPKNKQPFIFAGVGALAVIVALVTWQATRRPAAPPPPNANTIQSTTTTNGTNGPIAPTGQTPRIETATEINGGKSVVFTTPISRRNAFRTFYNRFRSEIEALPDSTDENLPFYADVPEDARPAVDALVKKGILDALVAPDNSLKPESYLTAGDCVLLLRRISQGTLGELPLSPDASDWAAQYRTTANTALDDLRSAGIVLRDQLTTDNWQTRNIPLLRYIEFAERADKP